MVLERGFNGWEISGQPVCHCKDAPCKGTCSWSSGLPSGPFLFSFWMICDPASLLSWSFLIETLMHNNPLNSAMACLETFHLQIHDIFFQMIYVYGISKLLHAYVPCVKNLLKMYREVWRCLYRWTRHVSFWRMFKFYPLHFTWSYAIPTWFHNHFYFSLLKSVLGFSSLGIEILYSFISIIAPAVLRKCLPNIIGHRGLGFISVTIKSTWR